MAPPTIYGVYMSTCTRRVLTTMFEKGVEDFTLVPIDLSKGQQKSPEFLAKQPFGVIPVYEDEDVTMYESRAIARHIAEKHAGQGTDLLGSTPKERALVNQWLSVEEGTYNAVIAPLIAEKVFKPMFGGTTDQARAEELKMKLSGILDIYEKHLADKEYLAGSKFSLADLSHLSYTSMLWASGDSELITSRPNVAKWWERISSRPSWQKVQTLK